MFAFLFSFAVGMSAVCLTLRRPILGLMNAPAQAYNQSLAYATICMVGLLFIYGYNPISAVLRGWAIPNIRFCSLPWPPRQM